MSVTQPAVTEKRLREVVRHSSTVFGCYLLKDSTAEDSRSLHLQVKSRGAFHLFAHTQAGGRAGICDIKRGRDAYPRLADAIERAGFDIA